MGTEKIDSHKEQLYASFLKHSRLFNHLDANKLQRLVKVCKVVFYEPGKRIIKAGEMSHHIFIIIHGRVTTELKGSTSPYELSTIGKREMFGVASVLNNDIYLTTNIALTKAVVLEIPTEYFKWMVFHDPQLRNKISTEIASAVPDDNYVALSIVRKNMEEAHDRTALSSFICNLLILLCLYIFFDNINQALKTEGFPGYIFSVPTIIIFFLGTLYFMIKSGYGFAFFGLTLENWQNNLIEAIYYSLPVLVLIVFGKYWLLYYNPVFKNQLIFNTHLEHWEPLLYLLFVPLQDIIRSGAQFAMLHFLTGRYRAFLSILITTLIFGISHMHLTVLATIVTTLVGFFWGWLLHKQKSILGLVSSHMLIGFFAFYVVGFGSLLG